MSLRTRLFLLVSGTVVPLVALALVLGGLLVNHERETFRRGAMDRNRAFMSAVDAEIHGHVTTLQALSAFRSIAAKDLPAIHDAARRVLATQPNWEELMLSAPDGRKLVDGTHAYGEPLAPDPDLVSLLLAVNKRAPVAGSIVYRPQAGKYGVDVRLPIIRDGSVVYVLTAVVDPLQFQRLIEAQDLPHGWVSGLVDRTGHFIARVPALSGSELASESFLNEASRGLEGWYRGFTKEGRDTFTGYRTSEESGWTVGLGIPAPIVLAAARRALWVLVIGTAIALAAAFAFAWWMSRRITAPIAALAADARALGRGADAPPAAEASAIEEVRDVATALHEAGAAVRERETLREREQAALKAADRAKDEFLAMLGHELRNPLSAISTAARVINAAAPGSPMDRQARAIVERQSRQMTRLIEDLLDISRLTMGKVRLRTERFDLAQLAENLVQTWKDSARISAARVSLTTAPVWIDADRARIEQVLANLLDNANKFTPADKAIVVAVRAEGDGALLEVSDEGDGIAADMLERIFELFVQGPQGPERRDGGLGLGLALVRRLVQMHGGTIEAKSAGPGLGSTFSVRLPASAAPGTRVERADAGPGAQRRALRVFLVEDNADSRDMVQAVLELAGHEVHPFASGDAVVAEARRRMPDAIVLDIGLPGVDGYEVARRVRADPATRSATLVALTGYGLAEDERRAHEAGFDVHFTKPVDPEGLLKALADAVPRPCVEPTAVLGD